MTVQTEVELVITAPESYAAQLAIRARARMTLGALTQLIARTEYRILFSVPFIQDRDYVGTPIYLALQSALERGVDVDIISTMAGIQVMRKKELGNRATGQLRYYRPQANIESERRIGTHAKVCVCDGTRAYVGSANLTIPGLNENLEMGLLVKGDIVQQISVYWEFLTDKGMLVRA